MAIHNYSILFYSGCPQKKLGFVFRGNFWPDSPPPPRPGPRQNKDFLLC